MATSPSQILRMPGDSTRELWLCDGSDACKPAARNSDSTGGIMALECVSVDSAPFWTAGSDATMDLESIVALHWEAMGLNTGGEGRSYFHWRVDTEESRVLVGTIALAAEAKESEWLAVRPDSFEASSRLMPIPPGEYAVWQELGRYAVGFTRSGHLLHVSVLNARALNKEAAMELRDLTLSLDARGMTGKCKGWRIWTEAEPDFVEELKQATGVKVRQEARPAPRLPAQPSEIIPPVIARLREERFRKAQFTRLIASLGIICFTFFATWAGWLTYRSMELKKTQAAQSIDNPRVEAVRQARLHWRSVEAATDPNASPVEVLHQVVSLLPDKGIQLKEFMIDEKKVVINGIASSVNHTIQLKAALQGNEALKRFDWRFDQPTFQEDSRANFRVEGFLLEGGSSNESE